MDSDIGVGHDELDAVTVQLSGSRMTAIHNSFFAPVLMSYDNRFTAEIWQARGFRYSLWKPTRS